MELSNLQYYASTVELTITFLFSFVLYFRKTSFTAARRSFIAPAISLKKKKNSHYSCWQCWLICQLY